MLTIIFDGGKNKKYGTYYSFMIFDGVRLIQHAKRVRLDVNTSNEAEYMALIEALRALQNVYEDQKIVIIGDSMLVINQVNGDWSVTADNLKKYHALASGYMKNFDNVRLTWWPNDQSKQFLGH